MGRSAVRRLTPLRALSAAPPTGLTLILQGAGEGRGWRAAQGEGQRGGTRWLSLVFPFHLRVY